ncbi:NPC intracellular cholesterol transporter 2-like [Euwallacea similis]|uniref:NPC intracellular cholesterol transporter 2-like n=1 Tax=Euwallacea similis TaxID=1736056 RepID=UPI00344DE433
MQFSSLFLVSCGLVACTYATQVNQCSGVNTTNLEQEITVENCSKPPCRLKKNTKMNMLFKFQPEYPFTQLIQVVNAKIAGVSLPFVGVDGADACDKIYEEDEKTKNNCHFRKGKTYVFKDSINVLQIYPSVKLVVHWSLTDPQTGRHAVCFELPARITN